MTDTPADNLEPERFPAPAPVDPPARPSWSSDELLGTADEVLIQHGEEFYRLRRTRRGKLILYK
ncbi:hemin uptake protein HemP [Lignipirellula cremea]|uniref:Hemin uptake protein hemP n=1 Tax=Lignipirellula cremea TaxID=2528010 RepID=A0A518DQ80_9BACT|nr:hemin uptake protein HemP [Lignipirellula cremea]QDU93987.1 hypothetical protein Pla8534_17730 [Lignipirellula cremea]